MLVLTFAVSVSFVVLTLMCLYAADIDECASNATNTCEHACFNTFKSFQCDCDVGFALANDSATCQGAYDVIPAFKTHDLLSKAIVVASCISLLGISDTVGQWHRGSVASWISGTVDVAS